MGDFNLNCFDYDSDSNISKYCETLFSLGLSPLISSSQHTGRTLPTHSSTRSGVIILLIPHLQMLLIPRFQNIYP